MSGDAHSRRSHTLSFSRRWLDYIVFLCRRWLCLLIASMLVSSCGESGAPVASETVVAPLMSAEQARLEAFFSASWKEDLARNPATASYLGVRDQQDRWNNLSESFQLESLHIARERLTFLEDIDTTQLSAERQLSYRLYRLELERTLAGAPFRHHRYVIHQYRGPHTSVVSLLINIHSITSKEDAIAYIARLNNLPEYFDGVIEQIHLRADKGLYLVDWMIPKMVESAGNVLSGAPFDDSREPSVIWADFNDKLDRLVLESAASERLREAARTALLTAVKPAYERLIGVIASQQDKVASADGVWRFPDGDAFYADRLQAFTTTDLTAEEVHQAGLTNVARLHDEMRTVMVELGAEGELSEFLVQVRNDASLRYPNTDEGRSSYLEAARKAIVSMAEKLPEYFGLLPQSELIVKRVEAYRERSAGKAFYQSPPSNGSRPGIYYANLYDMNSMPVTDLEALAYHEGLPGHHLQRAISAELGDVPDFQRHTRFTAYTEGWGLYSEYLAREMGFYQDPYSNFGRLAMELWRAARLVVDTGLHHKRWTREQAIAYLVTNTPNAEYDCERAIERYIAMPGQATAYMIGKLRIVELREMAREALGDQFDIRIFHDTVLGSGAVPLDQLEASIQSLIQAALVNHSK
ncbi:MAG: DUF885 domain-containing protein [Luminiphilus sp.]|jgi:uncharacterized protein (DUF885 family)|nr:DUF885 domain-containing protein [Luminiphilus sp.]